MSQHPKNGLPQSNPFAAPSVAAAESVHPLTAEGMPPLAQYSVVRTGLRLIYYSIATVAGLFVVMMVLGFALSVSGGGASMGGGSLFFLAGIVSLVAMLVMLVGFCMTIACPQSDEKPRAVISVLSFFLAFGISMVGNLFWVRLASPSNMAVASLAVSLCSNLLYLVSSVLFCLLLKRIGRNISSRRLERNARSMLVWYGILFVVFIVAGGLMSFTAFTSMGPSGGRSSSFARNSQLLGVVGGLAILVVALVVLFKYLAMLRAGIDELAVKSRA